jgi:hypothetical protein
MRIILNNYVGIVREKARAVNDLEAKLLQYALIYIICDIVPDHNH